MYNSCFVTIYNFKRRTSVFEDMDLLRKGSISSNRSYGKPYPGLEIIEPKEFKRLFLSLTFLLTKLLKLTIRRITKVM